MEGIKLETEIAPALRRLAVGEKAVFPYRQISSVRNTCSYLKRQERLKYITRQDGASETIAVIRVK